MRFSASQKYETDVSAHLDNKVQLQKGRFTFISIAKIFFTVQMGQQRGKNFCFMHTFLNLDGSAGRKGQGGVCNASAVKLAPICQSSS